MDLNKIYCRDCLKGLAEIEDNSIMCVWTDPPYNIGYNYDNYNDNREDYYEWCKNWISECYRILDEKGSLFIKMWSKNLVDIANILSKQGFIHKNFIIWKRKSTAGYKNCFLGGYEVILFYTKSDNNKFYPDRIMSNTKFTKRWDKKKRYKGRPHDIWTDIKPIYAGSLKHPEGIYEKDNGKKIHPAQHPQELVRRCIVCTTDEGDIVLDPFCGSGTSIISAKRMNRNFIGFEISKKYYNISLKRLKNIPEKLDKWFET